jgi:hypothetical protein
VLGACAWAGALQAPSATHTTVAAIPRTSFPTSPPLA